MGEIRDRDRLGRIAFEAAEAYRKSVGEHRARPYNWDDLGLSDKEPYCQVAEAVAAAEKAGPGPATPTLADVLARVSANDPWVSDLRFHPSDWDRQFDAKDKMRERRPEIIGAFDVAMNAVGRDKALLADQLGFIAVTAINVGTQLGIDMAAELTKRAALDAEPPR